MEWEIGAECLAVERFQFADDAPLQAGEEILETVSVHHFSIEQKKGRSMPPHVVADA